MGETGHSLLKRDIKAEDAILGGELSGHIVFNREYLPIDDALYFERYEGDVLPNDDSAGWEIFIPCEARSSESVENGHFVLRWTQPADAVNYVRIIAEPGQPRPSTLWVEWRFRSHHAPLYGYLPRKGISRIAGHFSARIEVPLSHTKVPKGRQLVATGLSPWSTARSRLAPEGRKITWRRTVAPLGL